jgi:hypothetical protein
MPLPTVNGWVQYAAELSGANWFAVAAVASRGHAHDDPVDDDPVDDDPVDDDPVDGDPVDGDPVDGDGQAAAASETAEAGIRGEIRTTAVTAAAASTVAPMASIRSLGRCGCARRRFSGVMPPNLVDTQVTFLIYT